MKNRIARTLTTVLLSLAVNPAAQAQKSAWQHLQRLSEGGKTPVTAPAAEVGGPAEGQDAPKDPLTAFKERIAKESQDRPLFQITESQHEGKPEHYLVIHKDQLGKPFLLHATIESAPGIYPVVSTYLDDAFLVSFVESGDKVHLVRRQVEVRADDGTPELKAIRNTVQDYILAVASVKASDKMAGYLVASAQDVFLGDPTKVALRLQEGFKGKMLAPSREASSLTRIKAFPKNLDVQVQLLYSVIDPAKAAQIPEGTLSVTMRYSLSALPEDPSYEPRRSDERVGYFKTEFQHLSRPDLKDQSDPRVHLINRWNLQKKEPEAPVSDVKEPIVFWLEDAIPHEYRDAVRKGILAWNAAFEAVGLRNALVVKQVPATGQGNEDMTAEQRASFDPADIAYNMVRWVVGGFGGAVGPSRANPLTGQIYHATISVGDVMARIGSGSELELASAGPGAAGRGHAALRERARREAAAALALREAQGPMTPEERARFVQEHIIETMAHETGHVLGLEHNFKGSRMLAQEELGKDGFFTSSIMDYNAPYLAPSGSPQGAYYQGKVGPYDAWAIEYGYKPLTGAKDEKERELKAIAARADSDPRLAYGNDADEGHDVDAQKFDLGKGAVGFAAARVALAKDLWSRMAMAPAGEAEEPGRLRERFTAGLGAYYNAVGAVLPVIGGVRTGRGGAAAYEPVAPAEQRAALAFIQENVFNVDAFKVSPELLKRLGADRLKEAIVEPFPIARYVGGLQQAALSHIYSPRTLASLSNREADLGPQGRLTPSEVFDRVRRSVWSELDQKKPQPVHLYRRNLQETHVFRLIETMVNPAAPSDARAAARRDLEKVARDVKNALGRQKDDTSRLHLSEMLRRAQEALDPYGKRR